MSKSTTNTYHDVSMYPTRWANERGLLVELLPFGFRQHDPIAELRALQAQFDEWPKTKATWSVDEYDGSLTNFHATHETPATMFTGAYRIQRSNGSSRWTNPRYVHDHTLEVVSGKSKLDYYLDAARIGVLDISDVAPRFGVTKSGVDKYLRYHGYQWGELRRDGQTRFARTVKTIDNWTDYSLAEIAVCVPQSPRTVQRWVSQHAADYEPPVDPSRGRA